MTFYGDELFYFSLIILSLEPRHFFETQKVNIMLHANGVAMEKLLIPFVVCAKT